MDYGIDSTQQNDLHTAYTLIGHEEWLVTYSGVTVRSNIKSGLAPLVVAVLYSRQTAMESFLTPINMCLVVSKSNKIA